MEENQSFNYKVLLRKLLNSLAWGVILAVNAWQFSVAYGILGAFLGGTIGFWTGCRLASSRLRIPVFTLGGLLLSAVMAWFSRLPIESAFIAKIMTAHSASIWSQGMLWFFECLIFVTVIHAISIRVPWFTAFELIIVANIALLPLSGHRDGFVSRPFFFVDPLWSNGFDPIPCFIMVGAVLAIFLVVLIIGRFNKRSTAPDLIILVLIIALLGIFLPLKDLQNILPKQAAGSEASGDKQKQSSSGGSQGQKDKEKDRNDKDNKDNKDNQDNKDNKQNDKDKNNSDPNDNSDNDDDKDNDDSSSQNDSPAAVVVFNDDYLPKDGYYYFRQDAKSFFNGLKLTTDISGRYDHDIASGFPVPRGPNPLTPQTVTIPSVKNVETKVALITEHSMPFGLINPMKMVSVPNPNTSQFLSAYVVNSVCFTGEAKDLLGLQLNNPAWSKADFKYYTELPADPRYKKLADQIIAKLPDQYRNSDSAKVFMFSLWLGKNSVYDTKVKISDSKDTVAKFLFGDRVGYCVHLANSMAYLCRASGIPARVAGGYACDAKNTYGGSSLLIMSSNAHSWCEVYVRGFGWYPVDVSPEKSNVQQGEAPDPDLQKMMGKMARDDENKKNDESAAKPQDVQKQLRNLTGLFGKFLAVLGVLALAASWVYKIWLHLAAFSGTGAVRINRVYKAALVCLAEAGVRRRYGETREEFAQRLADKVPSLGRLTEGQIRTDLGTSASFASYKPLPEDGETAHNYSSLKKEIGSVAPWWKRLLGIINPFAWLFVK